MFVACAVGILGSVLSVQGGRQQSYLRVGELVCEYVLIGLRHHLHCELHQKGHGEEGSNLS